VDAATNFRTFLGLLGMLRKKYINRNVGLDYTFHSVILAGVHDIKNIKRKMAVHGVYTPGPQEVVSYNSAWNIAADFTVDMSFHPEEIATMLAEYEADHHTGMDIVLISQELYNWTNGYPFLVSRLCMLIDRDSTPWTKAGVFHAVRQILNEQNTLFDDMFKNMEMYPDLYQYIYDILIRGMKKYNSPYNPTLNLALMYGFLRVEDERVVIANKIFELLISIYFMSRADDQEAPMHRAILSGVLREDVVRGGRFDMELALSRFAVQFRKLYSKLDADFFEKHARMLLLCYLSPLINGEGFYHIESQTTDLQRMDIVVDYGADEFIIELKLWHGECVHERAYGQLAGYLSKRGVGTGYLVTFDTRRDTKRDTWEKWVDYEGRRIFDVMV
jgi:hypothetical protein